MHESALEPEPALTLSPPIEPSQWIEEALVEAFTLRGLGRLAESWKTNPPFPGDNQFGEGIAKYRQNITRRYNKLAAAQGLTADPATWFGNHRKEIEVPALNPFAQAASLRILAEYEQAPDCVEALGALNRWPGRTGVPIEEYFQQWEAIAWSFRLTCCYHGACGRCGALGNDSVSAGPLLPQV